MAKPSLWFRKVITPDGEMLRPLDDVARRAVQKLKLEENYRVKIWKPRIPKHHRLVMKVLMSMVYPNQDSYDNEEDFLTEVKLRCGWYKEHITSKGKLVYVPKSINFEECDEDEFAVFHERLKVVIPKYFMHGVSMESLEDMVRRGETYDG